MSLLAWRSPCPGASYHSRTSGHSVGTTTPSKTERLRGQHCTYALLVPQCVPQPSSWTEHPQVGKRLWGPQGGQARPGHPAPPHSAPRLCLQ